VIRSIEQTSISPVDRVTFVRARWGLGRTLVKRVFKNDFIAIDPAGVTEADADVERFGAAGPGDVREFKRLEQAFAPHMLDDPQKRCLADSLALKPGIDHETPDTHLWMLGQRRKQRIVLEHDKANRLFGEVDGTVPGLRREQCLGQRDRVRSDEAFLTLGYGQLRDRPHRFSRDLLQRDERGADWHVRQGSERWPATRRMLDADAQQTSDEQDAVLGTVSSGSHNEPAARCMHQDDPHCVDDHEQDRDRKDQPTHGKQHGANHLGQGDSPRNGRTQRDVLRREPLTKAGATAGDEAVVAMCGNEARQYKPEREPSPSATRVVARE